MDKGEYQAFKGALRAQLGVNDAETFKWHLLKVTKNSRTIQYCSIAGMIVSIPLSLVLVGLITLPLSIFFYFMSRKQMKKCQGFMTHFENDTEFSVS